ncbi:hypothetical protein [Flavobacterium pedocola]
MKKYFYLFLMLPVLAIGQGKKKNYDYFVQFNTQQFAKKANLDSLFNHKVFKTFNQEESKLKLSEFMSLIDKTKPVTIHGNFTDSIPYYQISLPLVNDKGMTAFVQQKIAEGKTKDTIIETIKGYPKYQVYSPKSDTYTLAWNKNNLIVYGILNSNNKRFPMETLAVEELVVDSTAVVEEYAEEVVEVVEEAPVVAEEEDTVKVAAADDEDNDEDEDEEEEEDETYNEEYLTKWNEELKKQRELERIEKQAKQEAQIALLFEDGFVMPVSDKVNGKADISAWLNYQSVSGKMRGLSSMFRMMPSTQSYESEYDMKGMNCDFYFENDKARIEQTVEYSEALAKIVGKTLSGKPNKNIFKHFPSEEPLGYMSYHFNTEEMLKNYPKLIENALASLPIEKPDSEIITDLFSTLIDEEATATLFDGDLSLFLHTVESYSEKVQLTTYDENYDEVTEEKTVRKSRPVFSMVMTSTHPTMLTKILNLGVRKKALVQENNYYVIQKGTAQLGSVVLFKEGDTFVVTNGMKYLTNGSKSDFASKVKKVMAKNSLSGNLNIAELVNQLMTAEGSQKEADKMAKISNQFKNLQFKSSKKLKENKMKFEIELNSNFSDQNIILQALDFFTYLK